MKIAIVGGTGNIGSIISRQALAAGHQVRIMTRGGRAADELSALGAELFLGSFDSGTPGTETFFEGADAAFTMVRSDWSNPDHYPAVGRRIAAALRVHAPGRVVNLSAVGADLDDAGHNTSFKLVEAELDAVGVPGMVHLRAGWFAENFLSHVGGVAASGILATASHPGVPLPVVTTRDVARAAAEELMGNSIAIERVRDVQGPEDLTIAECAVIIAQVVGRPVRVVHTPLENETVAAAFLARAGRRDLLEYRIASNAAFADGRARFVRSRSAFDLASTPFSEFVEAVWKPAYLTAVQRGDEQRDDWQSWLDSYAAGLTTLKHP